MPRVARRIAVGERTYVRAPSARDRSRFVALSRRSRRLHGGWVSPPRTPKQFDEFLARARRADVRSFLVCRREDDDFAGVITISQIFHGNFRSAYLGFYAHAQHARQGFMREGLEAVLARAFTTLRLHRLEANIQPGNVASKALVKGLGFTREGFSRRYLKIGGRWRDHERWAITKEMWNERPRKRRTTTR